MSQIEDKLPAAVAGDEQALVDILREVEPELRIFVQRRIAQRLNPLFDADDVLQVTYLEAFVRVVDFRGEGEKPFKSWLFRIAENNLMDAVRTSERQRRMPPDKRVGIMDDCNDEYKRLIDQLTSGNSTPSRTLTREEYRKLLDASLEQIPHDYAVAVKLVELDGLSTEDAATAMNKSIGAVKMLRTRGRERLKEILELTLT